MAGARPCPWRAPRGWVPGGLTRRVGEGGGGEFYLDRSGTERLYHGEPLSTRARGIRAAVLAETRLSVSIGGGTSKLVAKLAASRAKPRPGAPADGVRVVAPGAEAAFLREFALAELPQVGPKFQERLARLGLHTVRDVVSHGAETLIRQLGEREGRWLYQQALGVDYAALP